MDFKTLVERHGYSDEKLVLQCVNRFMYVLYNLCRFYFAASYHVDISNALDMEVAEYSQKVAEFFTHHV